MGTAKCGKHWDPTSKIDFKPDMVMHFIGGVFVDHPLPSLEEKYGRCHMVAVRQLRMFQKIQVVQFSLDLRYTSVPCFHFFLKSTQISPIISFSHTFWLYCKERERKPPWQWRLSIYQTPPHSPETLPPYLQFTKQSLKIKIGGFTGSK